MLILGTILTALILEKIFDFPPCPFSPPPPPCLFLALTGLKSCLPSTVTFKSWGSSSFAVTYILSGEEVTVSLCYVLHMWLDLQSLKFPSSLKFSMLCGQLPDAGILEKPMGMPYEDTVEI